MARQLTLRAQTRAQAGRTAVKKIKQQGLVPAVIYGGKDQPQNLQVNAREISSLLAGAVSEHLLVELEIANGADIVNRLALIQEVQHDPLKGDVLHVDFRVVRTDEKIHAEVPIEPVGEATGVKNFGGVLEVALHSLVVECLPRDLPEVISIDVSELGVGQAIHVKDVPLPDGVTAKADPDLTVVLVAAPRVEAEPVPAIVAAQPEVLKEKKEEAGPENK
ncbi:MAG: 50S ribosomal protein L25 [Verrucomicrobiota bacterium]|nr:50S ribosomal protein L25 [Verrucomicrobiota bacterium]